MLDYTTRMLTHPHEVTGDVRVALHVVSDVVDTGFTAKPTDFYQAGAPSRTSAYPGAIRTDNGIPSPPAAPSSAFPRPAQDVQLPTGTPRKLIASAFPG